MNYLKKRGYFGHIGFDTSIILIWILLKCECETVDWMCMAQDREQWTDILNMVIKLLIW